MCSGHIEQSTDRVFMTVQARDSDLVAQRLLVAYSAWCRSAATTSITAFGTNMLAGIPETQYHPALRHVARALLGQLDEEDAFWALTWISDRLLPQYFSSAAHIGLQIYASIFAELVAHFLPRTAAMLAAFGLTPRELGLKWLPLCFSSLDRYGHVATAGYLGFSLWLSVLSMRSKARLAACVSLRRARLWQSFTRMLGVTVIIIFFQWAQSVGTPKFLLARSCTKWCLILHIAVMLPRICGICQC